MNKQEIEQILMKKGYTLEKIVTFPKSDRIRWFSDDLKVSLNLGKKIEDLSVEDFAKWVV